ncbi:SRPBCC domain-containing protein [Phytohabitans houttuyneae]|nr:SRPBCC domain-containing protein [Phytohabitans houttuyneae]
MDIDLEHPAERIWRALTEEKLLSQWLELPGFAPVGEAEVTGVEGQRRLAMLWGNDEVSTRLVWELASTPDGATLTLRQSCVYGEWEDGEREEVRAAYDSVLHERLPAILDWLAFQEVDLNAPMPGSPAEPATQVIPFVAPVDRRRGRGRLLMALSTAALVFVAIVAVAALTGAATRSPPPHPRRVDRSPRWAPPRRPAWPASAPGHPHPASPRARPPARPRPARRPPPQPGRAPRHPPGRPCSARTTRRRSSACWAMRVRSPSVTPARLPRRAGP